MPEKVFNTDQQRLVCGVYLLHIFASSLREASCDSLDR